MVQRQDRERHTCLDVQMRYMRRWGIRGATKSQWDGSLFFLPVVDAQVSVFVTVL